ncbi:voltage-dependent calcium channel subunit alpha-2/delta-3-like [Pollicipes pollicipes]|uniref:voltage-dependent calcium channel subunit alpha-2/delta-3-like n=1 Tax=Pollicipes pollicipes TaxID=41117 RepID=UPI0018852620|nr:voltage-dependent calcium channel subunit alpha-2/delta-3-like [Pollicipes pollicipes]
MTSISMPVFDKNSKGNVTEKVFVNNTQWVYRTQEKRVARLLGVAGTDVPLSDIQKHAPPHKLGVNGYSFLVDNNGYVLYHPDLRPVHREATKQFQEILKPNYNTVDLAEVEIVDNDEPRSNDTKLFMLRKDMIDRQKAETSLYVRQHLDDMKRVIKRRQKYYYHPVDSTPFSLGIALPDRYGDERVSGQVELTQAGRNREPILDYLEGPNWSVHPDWVYCEYDNQDTDAHSFDTPEDQYRHFLKKAISTSGFQWRSKRVYPVPEVKEPTGRYRSDETRSGTYFCDRDLFQSVVFDAKVTLSFKQGQSSSKHPLAPIVAQMARMGLFHTFGAAHSFVATRSGFTRWKTHWPRDMDVDREDMKFNGVRATDEVWYKRAVDYHDHDPTAFVYSVPFDAGLRNESLVTGAQALFLRKGSKRTPAAVVGMQFLHSRFREKFLSTANCPALGNCSQTCASDDLDCYLLDDSGFVVVSKRHEETGRFFGDVDGTVMNALLNHNVYRRITMFDYQGVCLDVVSTGSSAWTLLTPLRYLQWFASWLGGKMLWLLVQSNLLHLLDINLAWAAETVVNDNMDHGAGGDGDAMYDYDSKHTCVQVADSHQLFKMAHINKTRPRPCDKHVGLYTLNHNTKPLKASLEHCYGIDSSSCSRQFVLEKVPYTNLMMLVVNTLCPCEGDMISIEAHEWEYENGTQCARERLEPYRRRPQSCQSYHAEEENIDMCGRSGATRLVPLAVGWLALLGAQLVDACSLLDLVIARSAAAGGGVRVALKLELTGVGEVAAVLPVLCARLPNVSFPVWLAAEWLLLRLPNSTLTVFSGGVDRQPTETVHWPTVVALRRTVGAHRLLFELHAPLYRQLAHALCRYADECGVVASLDLLGDPAGLARSMSSGLSLDADHVARTELQRSAAPLGLTHGLAQGLTGLGLALLGAVAGIADQPLQGALTVVP